MSQVKKKEKLPFEDEEEILRAARRYFEEEVERVRKEDGNSREINTAKTYISFVDDLASDIKEELADPEKNYPVTDDLFGNKEADNNKYGRALTYLKNVGMIDTWGDETVGKTRWNLTVIEDDETFKNKLDALATNKNHDYIAPDIDVDTPYRIDADQ
jgi:hypothetical protein